MYVLSVAADGKRCRLFFEGPAATAAETFQAVQEQLQESDSSFVQKRDQAVSLLEEQGFTRIAH